MVVIMMVSMTQRVKVPMRKMKLQMRMMVMMTMWTKVTKLR